MLIWPPGIARVAERFVAYWNHHKARKQQDNLMPSESAPLQLHLHPSGYGGVEGLRVPVPTETIEALRTELAPRAEFLPQDAAQVLQDPRNALRVPQQLEWQQGWEVYIQVAKYLDFT